MSNRKNHAPAFKAKVALAAFSGEKTLAELSSEFGVHQTQISKWAKQRKESAAGIFSGEIKTEESKREKQLNVFHAKIGQLTGRRDLSAQLSPSPPPRFQSTRPQGMRHTWTWLKGVSLSFNPRVRGGRDRHLFFFL